MARPIAISEAERVRLIEQRRAAQRALLIQRQRERREAQELLAQQRLEHHD